MMTVADFHRAFDDLGGAAVLLDGQRRIQAANPAYERLAGPAVPGTRCPELHRCWSCHERATDLCRHRCPFETEHLQETPVPVVLDVRGARRGHFQRACARLYSEEGQLSGMLVFFFPLPELDSNQRELGRLERELRLASEVQSELLQLRRDPTPGWETALESRSCRPVGGDLAETLGRALYVADVSSKSVPAALTLQSVCRAFRTELQGDPAQAIEKLNRRLYGRLPPSMFVAAVAVFVRSKRRLAVVHAGLEMPWLYRSAGSRAIPLNRPGIVLGVDAQAGYEPVNLAMQPGDLLAVWSDGFEEALEASGDSPRATAERLAQAPPGELAAAVRAELDRVAPSDDATVLAARLQAPAYFKDRM